MVVPTPRASTIAVPEVVGVQLKNAVISSATEIPPMDPAQRRIFDEEVVPQYPLFVKDYKRVGQNVNAAVDLDGIKNIIRFSAQKNLGQPGARILLFLNVDSQCSKCAEESSSIRKIMQARVERRGLVPVWLNPEELAGQKIEDLAGPRGTVGYILVDLIPAPADDEDAAHADEKRFVSKAQLEIRGITHYQDQAEFYDTDSFETETQKLLTHAFTELGAKADLAGITTATSKDDLLMEFTNIPGFSAYTRLKTSLQTKLKGAALVEERRISKGRAVFALKTHKTADEIKTLLKGTVLDPGIQMEIR